MLRLVVNNDKAPPPLQHRWAKSKLGHGEFMCAKCFMTNREAAALGQTYKCEPIDAL